MNLRSRIIVNASLALSILCGGVLSPSVLAQSIKGKAVVSADTVDKSNSDNSGKKLAVARTPSINTPDEDETMHVESVQSVIESGRENLIKELRSRNINLQVPEVEIPDQILDTCDLCYVQAKQLLGFANEHASEFNYWFGSYLKQLTAPPIMTPAGSPYVMEDHLIKGSPGLRASKLYYTGEGRLKTVVDR